MLISVFARNANTGFRIFSLDAKTIVDNGHPPILLEPGKAEIAFKTRPISQVNILDHDGKPTGRTLPVRNGAKDQAIYYEIVLQ